MWEWEWDWEWAWEWEWEWELESELAPGRAAMLAGNREASLPAAR